MLHMLAFDVLLVVGPWFGARLLRSNAQTRRRLSGRPPMSLVHELRWLLLLLVPWAFLLAVGAYAIVRSCYEDEAYVVELAPGVTAEQYCDAMLQERFPGTLIAVTTVVAGVALVWTGSVLGFRASERRRAVVS
jgi:hypothetical protein